MQVCLPITHSWETPHRHRYTYNDSNETENAIEHTLTWLATTADRQHYLSLKKLNFIFLQMELYDEWVAAGWPNGSCSFWSPHSPFIALLCGLQGALLTLWEIERCPVMWLGSPQAPSSRHFSPQQPPFLPNHILFIIWYCNFGYLNLFLFFFATCSFLRPDIMGKYSFYMLNYGHSKK